MDKLTDLSLTGHGYLLELDLTAKPARAKIATLPDEPDSEDSDIHNPDQVIFDCQVPPDLAPQLQPFNDGCQVANKGVVRFKVVYRDFGACYAGRSDEPSHFLILKGELREISPWVDNRTYRSF